MSRVTSQSDFSNIEKYEDLTKPLSTYINELTNVINGNVQFGDNIKSQVVDVTFNLANTDVVVSHNLNKTDVWFIVVRKNVACDIYHGSREDSANVMFLRSTVATKVKVLLI